MAPRRALFALALGLTGCGPSTMALPTAGDFMWGDGADDEPPPMEDESEDTDTDTDSPPVDTAVDSGGDSGDTASPVARYAWEEDPGWWTEEGPLQGILDLNLAVERPHWRVWYVTSPDLENWTDPVVLGHNFSSLDLVEVDETGLILSGSLIPNIEAGIEGPFSNVFSLTTQDLVTWGSHFLPVVGADELPMIIDPSIHYDPRDGGQLRVLFFASSLDVPEDQMPDDYPNPHYIYTGSIEYDQVVVESLEPIVQGDHIVDPTGCYWHDRHHVLATNKYGDLFHQATSPESEGYADEEAWPAVQVPYCFVDELNDRLGLMAQHGGGHGPPRVRWCDASLLCEDQAILLPESKLFRGQCTSPVMVYYKEQYVLFCSSWWEGE